MIRKSMIGMRFSRAGMAIVLSSTLAWVTLARAEDIPAPAVPANADDKAKAEAAKKTAWHGDIALGLSLTQGNQNTLMAAGSASANKEWSKNILQLGIDGRYGLNEFGETNETTTASNFHGGIGYKRLITEKWYGNVCADGYYDAVQEVHYRFIIGPSAGYYFIKTEPTKLNGDIGMSYVQERVGSTPSDAYWTVRFGEAFEHAFTKGTKVWERVDYYPKVNDFATYLLNVEVGAEAALNTRLSLRVVFLDKYNSSPPPGIKPNDMSLICSLAFHY